VKRTVMISSLIALVVVVAFSVFLGTRQPASPASAIRTPLRGKVAPAFSGKELTGGHFSLKSDLGDIVVVNFWASWCGPCVEEAPNLSAFAWQERHHHVKVIGVVFYDTVSAATGFEKYYGSLYPSIVDPGGQIANSYGVTAPPTTFVINKKGRVVLSLIGSLSTSQLTQVVNRIRG
jgi:cytochrome c biogenesis protein CcmG, thiol:disulfide interchange protein DsbE